MRRLLGGLLCSLLSCGAIAPERLNTPCPPKTPKFHDRFDHGRLEALLQRFVDEDGLVDYHGLIEERAELDGYLQSLACVDLASLVDDGELKAYWINAYNALTLAGIARHYPTRSIRDLGGFWNRITADCGGRTVTLDEIEHSILRPLRDPRIHMAINCASLSCPRLCRHAYSGTALDAQLDLAAEAFLADERRNRFDDGLRSVELSMVFSWFARDFEVAPYLGVRGFLRRYAPGVAWLTDDYSISFLPYDWSINEQSND